MQSLVPARGDVLWIRERRWRVERARREREVVRLDVTGRDGARTFLAPFDRPRAVAATERTVSVRPRSAVARLAGLVAREDVRCRALPSAVDARIEILPYQLEPALALRSARRVLLADAVGLGKTVQTGLAIAELQRRDPALRVLVAVPSALRRQWREELREHFSVEAALADAGALDELARSAPRSWTPWDRAGVWIGSIDYLKQPHVLRDAARHVWDLLVIDEAHGACGETERHAAAETLARAARRVLLLSATPHGGSEPHFRRLLALGTLQHRDDPLLVFRRTRADLGLVADRRTRWHAVRLTVEETRVLDALTEFERTVLARGRRAEGLLLLSVFRKRALSTFGALKRSLDRRFAHMETPADVDSAAREQAAGAAWEQGRLFFDDTEDDVSIDERAALAADIGLSDAVERSWLRRLRLLATDAARHESRIRRLLTFARRCREPLAIFTEFRDSLNILRPRIEALRSAAILHGGMAPEEQHRQVDRFLSGAASVLLATDVASQGLNLQAGCRCVLNLELPWNPSRIEQRAGRVDRIGQRRRVHIGMFVARHEAESGLRSRLMDRSLAAQQSFGGGAPASVSLCARWSRPARAIARRLRRQRALASCWRGPLAADRPLTARVASLPHVARLIGSNTLLVFSAPILDGAGDTVERQVVCVEAARLPRGDRVAIEAARALVAGRLTPRVRRLRALLARERSTESDIEHALAEARAAICPRAEVQPGLFDRRAIEAQRAATVEAADRRDELQRRLETLSLNATITAGVPILVAVLRPSR